MNNVWTLYALFLAKTVTAVLAIAAVAVIVMIAVRRSRGRTHQGLRVKNVNHRYDELARTLKAGVLPKDEFKRELKADKRKRKTERAAQKATDPAEHKPRLYVLDFHGDVQASQVSALRQEVTAILTIATSDDEVLLRLQNPGGMVHDQGLAASQLLRLTERKIPLTVAVDKIAASGGYLMACVADRIVAAPFAIVGSIGVIAALPNFHRLLQRAGVDYEQFTGGEFKRTVTMFGATTDADRDKLREEIQDTHALFKEFVAEHRPQVDLVRAATGEHWYGKRALQLHLVDELITSDDYLLRRREQADIYEVSFPQPKSISQRLTSLMGSLVQVSPLGGGQ